jgi:hypothetical protein
VAEHLRHDRHRHTGEQHQRRRTVAEVMQPDRAKAGGNGQRAEALGDKVRPQRLPALAGEDQVAVLVRLGPVVAHRLLAQPLIEQCAHRPFGQAAPTPQTIVSWGG